MHAFDRDLRKEQPLGDPAETNDRGEYVIRYSVTDFSSGDVPSAPTPKLIVRAFEGDRQIGADVSRPQPTREEVVDFKTSDPVVSVSEWEKLAAGIMPLLKGQGQEDGDLPPSEVNDSDLNFIAEETGLEREKIRLWALAFTVGRDAAVVTQQATLTSEASDGRSNLVVAEDLSAFAIFYGWFRLGLPTELSALWLTPTDKLLATLSTAIAQGIVPSNIRADPDGFRKRIEHIKLDRVLQAPALGTSASLGDLLATLPTSLNLDQQRAIAAATDLQPDDQLVERIKHIAGFEDDALAVGVTHTLRLGALTAGHLPLAKALQVRLQHAEKNKGTLLPLAALRPDEWLDLAYTHGTPDGITITPVEYADALAASVEQQYPTAALAAHLSDGRRLARHPALTDVGTFLSDNTDFNIVTANLNAVTDQVKLGGMPEPRQVQLVAGLRSLQRMNVLGASWDETAALLENDLYSPHQLLVAGPTQLAARLDGRIAPERAAALYRQAENLHSTTLAAFTAGFSPLSAPRIMPTIKFGIPPGADDGPGSTVPPAGPPSGGGIPNTDGPSGSVELAELADAVAHKMANRNVALDPGWGRVVPPPRTGIVIPDAPHFSPGSVIDHQPTLQALFGSQDACACGHCSSVLSPAAYFVDVLEFIKNANLDYILLGNPGLEFPGRRPDLQDIELSCNNTNTVVPAIDLALEILENAVALPLEVELQPGTNVNDQLSGPNVGPEVWTALKKTVRTLPHGPGEVRATQDSVGGTTWTVVDGHRRWKITAQPENALKWRTGTGPTQPLDTTGVNLQALIAALDRKEVPKDAEAAFAGLFAPNQKHPSDYYANYDVKITLVSAGHSWQVGYQFVAQLLIEANRLTLQTAGGVVRPQREYDERTLVEVERELAKKTVPVLVQRRFAEQFSDTGKLTVKSAGSAHEKSWVITSEERKLTLSFMPAQVNITSLTYQSGDPDADPVAWPENHNPAAYAKLKGDDAVFPWSLPVDLPLEEVRLFLERARSSRLKMIELMLPVDERLLDDTGVTVPSAQSTREDTTLVFSKKNRNAITVPGDLSGTLTATVSVTKGELKVRAHPEVKIPNNDTNSVDISGSAAAINAALDGMAFKPPADYNGKATLTITATGDSVTLVASFPLTITPVVDIADDMVATEEDHAVTISVLANDSFETTESSITAVDGLAITAGGSAVAVDHGEVALDGSGRLIFTPTHDYKGSASFTYTVSSGGLEETATVHVAVNTVNSASFGFEVLGLSEAEAKLIAPLSSPSDEDIYGYWGLSSTRTSIFDAASGGIIERNSPLALLKNVSVLLQQSRLGFEELQAVFATQFAQGGTGPLLIEPQNICKPSEMTVVALTTGHLDRIHRFIRLWRKLGWTMRECDLAIQAFGGQLTPDTLIGLARLQQLNQQLELPVASLVGGIHLLETQPWTEYLTEGATVHPSLYATIFQREAVRSVNDFVDFALQSDGIELANKNLSISARADYIGACLRTKPSVVVDWVSPTQGLGIEDKLNCANLSRLTAAAGLYRALRIDPDKLTHHLKLYGATASPFQSGMSANDLAKATLEFVKGFRSIERSGVEVETLRYILQHYTAPGSNVDLDEKQLTADLAEAAREAVRSIPDTPEKTPPVAPAGPESVAARAARENAVITALATGLGAARELVDDLLRIRLRNPANSGMAAIEMFLSPLGDFIDLSSLVGKLRTHSDPVSAYLWNAFSAEDQRVLTNPASTALEQQTALVAALNQVLKGTSIYEASRFAGVNLSRETLALISTSPTDANLTRLNRLLLEEAYALEIAKRRLPDMSFVAGDLSQPLRIAVESVLVRLHKTALLCDALKLSRTDLPLLRTSATDICGFTALDFNTLPVASGTTSTSIVGFEQLLALVKLRSLASGAGDLLHQYAALNFLPPVPPAAWNAEAAYQVLMTGLTLSGDDVDAAVKQLHITKPEQYRDPITLTRLLELLVALKQLGATVKQVSDLTAPSPDDAAAISARELLRDKYGESQWHDLIKPIADKLRERQRDALVDYLLYIDQLPRPGELDPKQNSGDHLRDANDLYERYLINVQTGSCLKTTRLLQATAAVQLLVQRVLLNLERGASLSDDNRKLWDWMYNYRIWEANRKVFLFPENWLLPELRDDKTAIFHQMESALTEQEPSPGMTLAALLGYLDDFNDLSQISVIAMYEDRQESHTLYVVGRTPNLPYRYFWRSCAQFGGDEMSWTGWEALDLDNANDFIMPFVFEGDFHVAWPIFRKTNDVQDNQNLLWEVQIAWTRRTSRGWVKRKLSHETLSVPRLVAISELRSFVLRVRKDKVAIPMATSNLLQERIIINCYVADEMNPTKPFIPGLTRKDSPIQHGKDEIGGLSHDTLLNIRGQLAESYSLDNKIIYRPINGRVTLDYAFDIPNRQLSADTNEFGIFDFSSDYIDVNTGFGIVKGIRAANKYPFKLTLARYGTHMEVEPFKVLDGETIATIDGVQRFFAFWNWDFTHIVELPRPPDNNPLYFSGRNVRFTNVSKSFVLETGRDMELAHPSLNAPPINDPADVQRVGNRYARTAGGNVVRLLDDGELQVDHDFGLKVLITAATVPGEDSASPGTWHLQDDNARYYVRQTKYGWKAWPDGQEFVSWYRRLGAVATSELFDPATQAMTRGSQQGVSPATALSSTSSSISFKRTMPYANYNWELFLHLPLAIADYLASQQRFDDARRWLHAIFDPTTDKTIRNVPQYWRFLEFHNGAQPEAIAKALTWLAHPTTTPSEFEAGLATQIKEWKANPFMPHLIARLRPSAYQWHTFFAYLDVLIGWGDQLFRRDTRESVNDATLLYVLAAKLLGPRPRTIPAPTPPYALTYRLLPRDRNGHLDGFSNAWVDYADLPGVKQLARAQAGSSRSSQSFALRKSNEPSAHIPIPIPDTSGIRLLTSLSALAFCIPQNEKVTEFYDRVENRLFNVRNCRNIEGVFRELPLYEPPIDPLLLIRARAAGLDIDSVITDLYAPLPNYRFSFTLQKALELCAELKALGGALLSALEKKDAEALTLLRSGHEIAMLKLVRDTRKQQIAEAEANIAALQQSEETILERFGQYQKLLGKPSITEGQDGLPVVEQSSSLSVSTDAGGEGSGLGLIRREVEQLGWAATANSFTQAANAVNLLGGVLALVPTSNGGAPFASLSFGGIHLGGSLSAIAKAIEMGAVNANYQANQAGTFGVYERRQDEWVHQSKLALAELKQIQKQIVAAEIRKDIAERELSNHDTQIDNAQQVEDFMRSKFTSQQLYRWLSSQIAEVYFRTYQLALDQARRTERAYLHELGLNLSTAPFVQTGNWDTLKRGLLAGEHLHHDLKRMESAYLERNVREFEITKHISLLQLDPGALIALRQTDKCDFDLPEVLFDLDYPGHYMRRIKMVSLSIPCVAGPYASVSATLRLIKNEIRAKPTASGTYKRRPEPEDDSRFMKTAATITAVVTSSAQQDSGMFEPNLRDERYLPFEGAGVISTWRIELPSEFHAFDYDTIADVVLHVRYTARNSDDLKTTATASGGILSAINSIKLATGKTGMTRLLSLRQEFPTEWRQLIYGTNPDPVTGNQSQVFPITKNRFPFLFAGKQIKISSLDLYAVPKAGIEISALPALTVTPPKNINATWDVASEIGRLRGKTLTLTNPVEVEDGTAKWNLEISNVALAEFQKDIDDILIVCRYSVSEDMAK